MVSCIRGGVAVFSPRRGVVVKPRVSVLANPRTAPATMTARRGARPPARRGARPPARGAPPQGSRVRSPWALLRRPAGAEDRPPIALALLESAHAPEG